MRRRDVFIRDDLRYTQWSLIEHDRLYLIGDFATLGSADVRTDTAAEVRELLAAWKADRPALLQRFDLDGDGEIDLREWELARAQARREVRQRQTEALAAPELHVMRRPSDRRLYLISDLDPERIGRQFRWIAAFHATVFSARPRLRRGSGRSACSDAGFARRLPDRPFAAGAAPT